MAPYAGPAELCAPDGTRIDQVHAFLRSWRGVDGARWGGELVPPEGHPPAPWPQGEITLRLSSGDLVRATIEVVRAASGPVEHQMARVSGRGPFPEHRTMSQLGG